MLDLESMNLADLKLLAKEHNIKNISKLKKDELVTMLTQIMKETGEKLKQFNGGEKGITLVALVITIVILIIIGK